jgi:hypothetical protein
MEYCSYSVAMLFRRCRSVPIAFGVRFPTGVRDFSLFHRIQTDSEPYTASYSMDTGGSFHEDKAARE